MPNLNTLDFKFWDPLDAAVRAVERWIPPASCNSERALEASLVQHLGEQFPGFVITPQYAIDRFRVDVVIERRVAIELKYQLQTMAEYERLIGQIEELARAELPTVVVLAGETDPDIARRVGRHLEDCFTGFIGGRLILKP